MLYLMHLIHHVVHMFIKNSKNNKNLFFKELKEREREREREREKTQEKKIFWTRGIEPLSHFNSFSKILDWGHWAFLVTFF